MADANAGIVSIREREFTGISCQLIDPARLDASLHDDHVSMPADMDGHAHAGGPRRLIVNIDYAFGNQAEDVLASLILLFRGGIRSISVMGKAGLTGRRGDILMPTHFLLQCTDELRSVENRGLVPEAISKMSGRTVHSGPLLTIEGTLLQNRRLLKYYHRLWRCVGLEMEGSHYARQVERGVQLSMLPADVAFRRAASRAGRCCGTRSQRAEGRTSTT